MGQEGGGFTSEQRQELARIRRENPDLAAFVDALRDGCEGRVMWVREAASGFEVGERDNSEGVQPTMPDRPCSCEACRRRS